MSYKQGGSAIKSAQTRKIFSNTKPRKGEDYWIWFDNFFILSCIDYYHTMDFLFFILFFYFLGYTELFLIQIVKRKINFWWTAEAAVHSCSIKMHFWLDLKFFEKKKRFWQRYFLISEKKEVPTTVFYYQKQLFADVLKNWHYSQENTWSTFLGTAFFIAQLRGLFLDTCVLLRVLRKFSEQLFCRACPNNWTSGFPERFDEFSSEMLLKGFNLIEFVLRLIIAI